MFGRLEKFRIFRPPFLSLFMGQMSPLVRRASKPTLRATVYTEQESQFRLLITVTDSWMWPREVYLVVTIETTDREEVSACIAHIEQAFATALKSKSEQYEILLPEGTKISEQWIHFNLDRGITLAA